jgi:hypothetical protein
VAWQQVLTFGLGPMRNEIFSFSLAEGIINRPFSVFEDWLKRYF